MKGVCDDLAARVADVLDDRKIDVQAVELALPQFALAKQGTPAQHLRTHSIQ